jgi:archaellum component FlaF (FlaF/FlaG flagellin family)
MNKIVKISLLTVTLAVGASASPVVDACNKVFSLSYKDLSQKVMYVRKICKTNQEYINFKLQEACSMLEGKKEVLRNGDAVCHTDYGILTHDMLEF